MRKIAGATILSVLVLGGCQGPAEGGGAEQATADSAAIAEAEERIAELNARWVRAVAEEDTDSIVSLHAEDGRIMPPGQPAAVGHDALEQAWSGVLAMTDSLTFETEVLEVSPSATMAYDIGSYRWAYRTPDGESARDRGKFVVIWEKRDGQWKVVADIFNSNGAPGGSDGGGGAGNDG